MTKDLFGRHAHSRSAGTELREKATDDISFVLKYKRSDFAFLFIALHFKDGYFILSELGLSFCLRCGRFIGFGNRFEVCWLCEDELE
jgi:hypothetical protein